ncbi:MAG: Gfo/Idh/MocA family protein [Thermogutta sp.]
MHPRFQRRLFTRRAWLRKTASGLAAFGLPMVVPRGSVFGYEVNERLAIALVGVSGRGQWFVQAIPAIGERVVALCDVHERRAAAAFEKFPNVPKFSDFRRMLDAEGSRIDAVVIAVPDHNHAVIANTAIRLGKHVYCEKPLTHDVREARILRLNAERHGVVTQMGNQGTATDAFREGVEWIQSGRLGSVKEVYVWKDSGGPGLRPVPQGRGTPPDELNWDVWLGPAADRPFDDQWLQWHTWRDFATGNLGNWGSHSANMAFMGLRVDSLWQGDGRADPIVIRAEVGSPPGPTHPRWEIVEWRVPAREQFPPVVFRWFNGSGSPGQREQVEALMGKRLDWGDAGAKKWDDHAGSLIVGERAMIHATGHNSTYVVLPRNSAEALEKPPQTLPRHGSHEREWAQGCKGGRRPMSHFGYSGPLTEFLMLGNVATLFPERDLEYDAVSGRIRNDAEADAALFREYRKGWRLEES